jgi:hypothetical protein
MPLVQSWEHKNKIKLFKATCGKGGEGRGEEAGVQERE